MGCRAITTPISEDSYTVENHTSSLPVIIRLPEVSRMIGLSRASIYRMVKAGTFPASVPLGEVAVGWLRAEVEGWIAECVRARNAQAA